MPKSRIDDALCDALEAAGTSYQLAMRMLDAISEELTTGQGGVPVYERLQQIARKSRDTETEVSRLQQEWRRQGAQPSERLQGMLRRQETTLRALITCLDRAETIARSSQGPLVREVDAATRSHRMHTAYARTVRQAAE